MAQIREMDAAFSIPVLVPVCPTGGCCWFLHVSWQPGAQAGISPSRLPRLSINNMFVVSLLVAGLLLCQEVVAAVVPPADCRGAAAAKVQL